MMPLPRRLSLLFLSLTACTAPSASTALPSPSPLAPSSPTPTYQAHPFPTATVHLVTLPPGLLVHVALADSLTPTADLAAAHSAFAALNAGFFDPQNGQTTSYVLLSNQVVADPRQNPRLMDNPDLQTLLPQILNRSEFRRYDCDGTPRYAIVPRAAAAPCPIAAAVGGGPQLLPANTAVAEAFLSYRPDGTPSRDAIGSLRPNARSAVALKPDGTVLLAMVAQTTPSGGMTLDELADFLRQQGAEQALNLDGGSSASLVYDGAEHYGRLNSEGTPVQRPVKSILWTAHPH